MSVLFTLAEILRAEKLLRANNLRAAPRRLRSERESFFQISGRVAGTRVLQKSEGDFHATSESHSGLMTRNLSAAPLLHPELVFDLPEYYYRRNFIWSCYVC